MTDLYRHKRCPVCEWICDDFMDFLGHVRNQHGGFGRFRCPFCGDRADGFDEECAAVSLEWYPVHFQSCVAYAAWALSGVKLGGSLHLGTRHGILSDEEVRLSLLQRDGR